jgi:hypothetical protein
MRTSALRSFIQFLAGWLLLACQAATQSWAVIAEYNVHHSVMTAGFSMKTTELPEMSSDTCTTRRTALTWVGSQPSDCRYGMEILDEGHA